MNRLLIFQNMMALTVVSGCLVAFWLAKNASSQKGIKALAGFNFMMALWCCGHLLLSFDYPRSGQVLLSLNPLMPTLFLHFSLEFVCAKAQSNLQLTRLKNTLPLWYAISSLVVIISIGFSGNTVQSWLDFPWVLMLTPVGWANLLYTVLIGLVGHGILLWGYSHIQGSSQSNTRQSILMMFAAGAWGFALATSYILPSLGLHYYPYPLWLLPSYLLLLTFAVVRYQLLAVNSWAIKAIIWALALLLLLGLTTLLTSMASQVGLTHFSAIPFSVLWLYSLISGITLWLLYNPLHNLASRLVYPDVKMTEAVTERWLTQLNHCLSFNELNTIATNLLSTHLQQPVAIVISEHSGEHNKGLPQISCYQQQEQQEQWVFQLKNWQETSPGFRHVADIFASLLITTCDNLDKSLRLAHQEQQRQEELRLVELGGLAAAMAHELRNPLNIISMASAQCEDKVKNHIQGQLKRADTLIQDMLSYSRVIELNAQSVPLLPMLTALSKEISARHKVNIDVQCDAQLLIYADVYKLQQVLVNCLDNAGAFAGSKVDGRVLIECEASDGTVLNGTVLNGTVLIRFHNNGPAISPALQAELFKPFISKRAGGSGLGLAIVQRIIKAHGGKVTFSDQLGWAVSFICVFPGRVQAAR